MTFTAVAEVHVSAAVNEEDKFIAQVSGQHVVCDTDLPAILNAPPGDRLVNQPEMYSAQKIDLDGMPMEEVVVLDPLEFSAPDASLDSRPIAGNMDWNPSDYVVHNDKQTRRPTEGVTSPAPVRHSVMQFHLDSQPGRIKLKPDQSGDPWPNGTPRRQVNVCGSQTVPDILVDANMDRGGNPVLKPAPSELAEHLTSVEHSLWQKDPKENEGGNPVPKSAPSGLAERSTSVENSPGPIYPMPDDKSGRRVCFYDSQTVSKLLVDFGADGGGNPVPKPAPSELAENLTLVENRFRSLQAGQMEHPSDTPRRVVRVSDNQPVSEPRQSENQEIRNQPVSELSVRGRHHRGRLLPETDGVPRPPPVALPRVVSGSRQSEDLTWMEGPENTGKHLQQHTPETHDHQKNVCSDMYPHSKFSCLSNQ